MADRNDQTLGDLIREARVATKRSLRDVAKTLEIAPSYLSDIENDRRVPAEEILRKMAALFSLDYDDLMARIGRFGERAERYLKRHPAAGVLFRQISDANLPDDALKQLLRQAEQLNKKRDQKS